MRAIRPDVLQDAVLVGVGAEQDRPVLLRDEQPALVVEGHVDQREDVLGVGVLRRHFDAEAFRHGEAGRNHGTHGTHGNKRRSMRLLSSFRVFRVFRGLSFAPKGPGGKPGQTREAEQRRRQFAQHGMLREGRPGKPGRVSARRGISVVGGFRLLNRGGAALTRVRRPGSEDFSRREGRGVGAGGAGQRFGPDFSSCFRGPASICEGDAAAARRQFLA